MLTSNIDGLMSRYTGGALAAGAGAIILIVMQVTKEIKKKNKQNLLI